MEEEPSEVRTKKVTKIRNKKGKENGRQRKGIKRKRGQIERKRKRGLRKIKRKSKRERKRKRKRKRRQKKEKGTKKGDNKMKRRPDSDGQVVAGVLSRPVITVEIVLFSLSISFLFLVWRLAFFF